MRNPADMTVAERRAELDRQAQAYADAMTAAIREVERNLDPPMLNALAGAVLTIEAGIVASISDPRGRKAIRREMERQRPQAIAEAVARRTNLVNTKTVTVRSHDS